MANEPSPEESPPRALLRSLLALPAVVQQIAARESLTPEQRLQALSEYARALEAQIAELREV